MKPRQIYCPVKRKLFIPLLFTFIFLLGLKTQTIAQGWTFTFSIKTSGPCTGVPAIPIPALPNFGIPTKGECESIRQTLLAIKSSYPVTDSKGRYIGDCVMYVDCTPCTGSDLVVASQVSSGDVSFNGQYSGKPLYTSHESTAFEDWSNDYKQQLESFGITSILGNTLTAPQVPLTGDRDFDSFYSGKTSNFNPTTPAVTPPNNDASVVDLSGKAGVVGLLTTPEQQAKRDKWYQEKGFDNLTPMTSEGAIDENTPAQMSFKEKALRFAIEQVPGAGTIGSGMLKMVDVVFGEDGLPKAVNQATRLDFEGGVETSNKMQNGIRNQMASTMTETIQNSFSDGLKGGVTAGSISTFKIGEKGEKAVGIITWSVETQQAWNEKK